MSYDQGRANAEARIDVLGQALEPFAALAEELDRLGHGDGSTCEWRLKAADIRRAAEALAGHPASEGKVMEIRKQRDDLLARIAKLEAKCEEMGDLLTSYYAAHQDGSDPMRSDCECSTCAEFRDGPGDVYRKRIDNLLAALKQKQAVIDRLSDAMNPQDEAEALAGRREKEEVERG